MPTLTPQQRRLPQGDIMPFAMPFADYCRIEPLEEAEPVEPKSFHWARLYSDKLGLSSMSGLLKNVRPHVSTGGPLDFKEGSEFMTEDY